MVEKQSREHLDVRSRKVCEGVCECLHILSNEPSLALYRIQEHVRKSLPQLLEKKSEAARVHKALQGCFYDIENASQAVDSMLNAVPTFARINELLKTSMFYKQQLDYEQARRENKKYAPVPLASLDTAESSLRQNDSADSLLNEVRKSKSMMQFRLQSPMRRQSSTSGAAPPVTLPVSGRSTTRTRSTSSTPVNDFPDSCTPLTEAQTEMTSEQLWMLVGRMSAVRDARNSKEEWVGFGNE